MNNKLKYLATCARLQLDRSRIECPSCGSMRSVLISRKYFVTALKRCENCALLFRVPTTSTEENERFYQTAYSQGFTSDMPSDEELFVLKQKKFQRSNKDYRIYLNLLQALGANTGQRILDFGCSWGYGSWQFREFGFDVESFEISKPRCRYAREKLDIPAFDALDQISNEPFDIFFSAHVLEHVPSVSAVFELARNKLKKGGLFVAFTPNGSEAYRKENPQAWQGLWGMVHPNFLDDTFYRNARPDVLLRSNPYDLEEIRNSWACDLFNSALPLTGSELMAAFRMM